MSETKAASGGLTRRSFLKTTGAVAGAMALSELASCAVCNREHRRKKTATKGL